MQIIVAILYGTELRNLDFEKVTKSLKGLVLQQKWTIG